MVRMEAVQQQALREVGILMGSLQTVGGGLALNC